MVPDLMDEPGGVSIVPAMHNIMHLQDLLNPPASPSIHSSEPARLGTPASVSWPVIRATLSAVPQSSHLAKTSKSHHHHHKYMHFGAMHHYVLDSASQYDVSLLQLGHSMQILAGSPTSLASPADPQGQTTLIQQQQRQESTIASSAVSRAPQMQEKRPTAIVRDLNEEDMIAMGIPIATFSDIQALAADVQAPTTVMVLHVETSPTPAIAPSSPAATTRTSESPMTSPPTSSHMDTPAVDSRVPLTFTIDYLPPRFGHATPITLPKIITAKTTMESKVTPAAAVSPTIISATRAVPKTATASNSHGPINSGGGETADLPLGFIALIVIGILFLTGVALYFYFRRRGRRASERTHQGAMANSTISHPILSDDDDDDDEDQGLEEKLRRIRPGGISHSAISTPISKSFDRRSAGRVQLPTDSFFVSDDATRKKRSVSSSLAQDRGSSVNSQRPSRTSRSAPASRDTVTVPRATRRQNTGVYAVHGLATVGAAVQGSSASTHATSLLETPESAQHSANGAVSSRAGIRKPKNGRSRVTARHSQTRKSLATATRADDLLGRLKQRVGNMVSPRSQPAVIRSAVIEPVAETTATIKPASPLPAGAPGSCESISDNYQFSKRHKPPLGPLRAVEPHIPSLPDELAVQRGDSVFVLGEFADGWVLAMNASRNNECGMIPRRCLFFSTAQFMTPSAIKASQASQQSQLSRQKPTQKPDPNEKAKPKTPSTDSRHRRRPADSSHWKSGDKEHKGADGYFKEILHKL